MRAEAKETAGSSRLLGVTNPPHAAPKAANAYIFAVASSAVAAISMGLAPPCSRNQGVRERSTRTPESLPLTRDSPTFDGGHGAHVRTGRRPVPGAAGPPLGFPVLLPYGTVRKPETRIA